MAIEISKSLATEDQVWHLTRNIDESIRNQFIVMNVNLLVLDLNAA